MKFTRSIFPICFDSLSLLAKTKHKQQNSPKATKLQNVLDIIIPICTKSICLCVLQQLLSETSGPNIVFQLKNLEKLNLKN